MSSLQPRGEEIFESSDHLQLSPPLSTSKNGSLSGGESFFNLLSNKEIILIIFVVQPQLYTELAAYQDMLIHFNAPRHSNGKDSIVNATINPEDAFQVKIQQYLTS